MKQQTQLYLQLLLIAIALFLAGWFFTAMMVYVGIAIVVSLIGRPIVDFLKKIHYKGYKVGNSLAAGLTLFSLIGLLAIVLSVVGPMVSYQASLIGSIDLGALGRYYAEEIDQLNELAEEYKLLPPDVGLNQYIEDKLSGLLDFNLFSGALTRLISATGSLFMGLFTVLFLGFFFLKEPWLLHDAILLVTPQSFESRMKLVIEESRSLLSRYFIGLAIEVASMMFILSLILSLFGINNAMLIGFMGGLFNVIPYLGPIIGATLGAIMSVVYLLAYGQYDQLIFSVIVVIGTFSVANLFDNIVLQPLIYSKSVKAHPVEIFLVIIMAGQLAGIGGMIAAIPVYTVLKVIIKTIASREALATSSTHNN
ncbi:MAG: AI-2E family transporter [Bacteroidetes bacterium]|nr:AI-2E family transporter [Bacteroidota bacterium]